MQESFKYFKMRDKGTFCKSKNVQNNVRFVCINMYENLENPNCKYCIDQMEKSHF